MASQKIKAVLFDMDGTVVDVPYDWREIKEKLETGGVPILEYLSGLQEPECSRKWMILTGYEDEATARAVLKDGLVELLEFLASRGIRTALVTNNSEKNTRAVVEKFGLCFDHVLSRESGLWKPSGAPFRAVLQAFGLGAEEGCVVGDSFIDIRAAENAGIRRIFILSDEPENFAGTAVEVLPDIDSLRKRLGQLEDGRS